MEANFDKFKKSGGDDMVNKVLVKKRKKKSSKNTSLMPRDMLFSTSCISVLPSNIKYQNHFSLRGKVI